MVNDFYKEEWRRIRANPAYGEKKLLMFDTVLVHETDDAEVVGLKGELVLHNHFLVHQLICLIRFWRQQGLLDLSTVGYD